MASIIEKVWDVIVIGAGAAGLMAAATAGKRGKTVLLLEHTNKIAEKIRISGGGKCNFTNLHASPKNYLSKNSYFAISALSKYTQDDFIKLVESYNITYYEKTLGQLFCHGSSTQIINMLLEECTKGSVEVVTNCQIENISKSEFFELVSSRGKLISRSLIIATGGLSIPKLGATDFGYQIAKQFGLNIIEPQAALVPLTVGKGDLEFFKSLSGIAIPSVVYSEKISFKENILFTHRGLSGPAILQISSYLNFYSSPNISIDLLPGIDISEMYNSCRTEKVFLNTFLKNYLPNRFVENWSLGKDIRKINDYSLKDFTEQMSFFKRFDVNLTGHEGFAKAEVTVGGIDTNELSSKTMEAKKVPGLYFVGEVVDVTGWLGGYNFQWAWSSGYAAGSYG